MWQYILFIGNRKVKSIKIYNLLILISFHAWGFQTSRSLFPSLFWGQCSYFLNKHLSPKFTFCRRWRTASFIRWCQMHIIRALSMLSCCMQLVTVIHLINRKANTDWHILLFVLCISSFTTVCHFSFVSCVTSYTQIRKHSDNVHKDIGIRFCVYLCFMKTPVMFDMLVMTHFFLLHGTRGSWLISSCFTALIVTKI
jgi:hypothetical protein